MNIFVCPMCGEADINELTVCVVSHPVRTWSDSGIPTGYSHPIVDWQSDYPYSLVGGTSAVTFECGNCGEQFEAPKRSE